MMNTATMPLFFSNDTDAFNEKSMIDRIISRTDAITAKELEGIEARDSQVDQEKHPRKRKVTVKPKTTDK